MSPYEGSHNDLLNKRYQYASIHFTLVHMKSIDTSQAIDIFITKYSYVKTTLEHLLPLWRSLANKTLAKSMTWYWIYHLIF